MLKKFTLWTLLFATAFLALHADDIVTVGGKSKPVQPVVVYGLDAAGNPRSSVTGAAHLVTSQVTTSTTAGTACIARATRRSVLIRNLDTTISVYIGNATVTTSTGMLLKAGESIPLSTVELVQVISASGAPVIAIADEYD